MSETISLPVTFVDMAEALLARNDLHLRAMVMEWQRTPPPFDTIPQPETGDPRVLVAAAALVELLAQRAGQAPPAWTATVGALPEPFFAVEWAERPGFTRTLSLTGSPEPFKRHTIFSPPNFLMMA